MLRNSVWSQNGAHAFLFFLSDEITAGITTIPIVPWHVITCGTLCYNVFTVFIDFAHLGLCSIIRVIPHYEHYEKVDQYQVLCNSSCWFYLGFKYRFLTSWLRRIAKIIANQNGPKLAHFISDFKDKCQHTSRKL